MNARAKICIEQIEVHAPELGKILGTHNYIKIMMHPGTPTGITSMYNLYSCTECGSRVYFYSRKRYTQDDVEKCFKEKGQVFGVLGCRETVIQDIIK